MIHRKYFSSCEELPLFNWIKLITSSDLKYLWKERKKPWHKENDLNHVWEKIFEEYTELSNDKSSNHVLSMIKNISVINNKLEIIQSCVNLLSKIENIDEFQPCVNLLRSYGFRFKYSNETLIEDLKRTVSSAKTMVIQRSQIEKEYQNFADKQEKATEKNYYDMLAHLSKFLGFPINPKETTVLSYISYVEQYNNSLKDGK